MQEDTSTEQKPQEITLKEQDNLLFFLYQNNRCINASIKEKKSVALIMNCLDLDGIQQFKMIQTFKKITIPIQDNIINSHKNKFIIHMNQGLIQLVNKLLKPKKYQCLNCQFKFKITIFFEIYNLKILIAQILFKFYKNKFLNIFKN